MIQSQGEGRKPFPIREFLKSIASLAIPVALANLLTTTGSMVDTMMLAPLGETTVAAVGLCAQFTSLMLACYWGFVGGGMLFFAQYYGAKDEDGICRSYGMTLSCMMTVGLIFAAAALLLPEWVMKVYTDKQSIRDIGEMYLKVVGFAYPMQVFAVCVSSLLRSTAKVKVPLYASIVSVCVNVGLNYVLIYGKLGFPVMGVRGAALATVISAAVNVVMLLTVAALTRYPYLFRIRSHFRFTREFIREYFTKCFPIICNELLIGIGNMGIAVILGHQSEAVVAAVAVFRTLEGMIIGFFAGFSNAASVLVGTCVGAGELETAYQRAIRIVYLCAGVIGVICLTLLCLSTPILTAMGLSGESFAAGKTMLGLFSVIGIIRMGNWTMNDTYRSAGDAVTGTVSEIVTMYTMVLPAAFLAGMVFHAPLWVIFLCCYCDEALRSAIMQRHLFTGRWIRPVTPQGRAALPAFHAAHPAKRLFGRSGN